MWSRGMSSCGAKGTVRVKDERWAEAVGLEHRALAGGGGGGKQQSLDHTRPGGQ